MAGAAATRRSVGSAAKKRAMQVSVVVRVRPALAHEKLQPVALTVAKSGQHSRGKGVLLTMQQGEERSEFLFDKCYDDATPQRLLFQREIQPAIAKVLTGVNTTVFAYGATGTGKTFTMEGSKRNLGMIPRSVKRLFEVAAEQKTAIQIDMSYLEIYNDRVLDLLVAKSQQQDLPIRQQTDGTIAIQGLTRKRIASLLEFEELYEKGSASRARAATDMNPESSRSHSILMIQARSTGTAGQEIRYGKLHLIDLAGSEDNRRTGNSGARLQESGKINMSLFVLGKVITALNAGDVQRIPFRDSKLTRLLQDSLGGSSHAVMICNVAQTVGMYQECLQTLNYAAKAKGIVNQVAINTPTAVKPVKKTTEKASVNVNEAKVATSKLAAVKKTAVVASKASTTPTRHLALKQTTPSSASRLQKATASSAATVKPSIPARKPLVSVSPPKPTTDPNSLEQKLSAWREAKLQGRANLEKRASTDSNASSSSIGVKRPTPVPSSKGLVPAKTLTSRTSTASAPMRVLTTDSSVQRVPTTATAPATKKPRLSMMPTSTTTASRKSLCPNPARRSVGSPSCDKENVCTNAKPTKTAAVVSPLNIMKDLTPVDLAKKLIGVAIDFEKKKQFIAAYCVFKRAYHVLPEENPKLLERLHALEAEAPTATSMVPSQQMSTAVYMQLVLEMNLLEVLNSGSQQELCELHSIGDKRADKIMELRPFSQLSDLLRVPGLTDKLLQKLHDHHVQW